MKIKPLSLKFTTFQQKHYLFKEENIIIYILVEDSILSNFAVRFCLKYLSFSNYFSANGINLHYFPAVRVQKYLFLELSNIV